MYMFTVVISFGVQIYFDDKHLVGPGKKMSWFWSWGGSILTQIKKMRAAK